MTPTAIEIVRAYQTRSYTLPSEGEVHCVGWRRGAENAYDDLCLLVRGPGCEVLVAEPASTNPGRRVAGRSYAEPGQYRGALVMRDLNGRRALHNGEVALVNRGWTAISYRRVNADGRTLGGIVSGVYVGLNVHHVGVDRDGKVDDASLGCCVLPCTAAHWREVLEAHIPEAQRQPCRPRLGGVDYVLLDWTDA
jgi:hypothetical protein